MIVYVIARSVATKQSPDLQIFMRLLRFARNDIYKKVPFWGVRCLFKRLKWFTNLLMNERCPFLIFFERDGQFILKLSFCRAIKEWRYRMLPITHWLLPY